VEKDISPGPLKQQKDDEDKNVSFFQKPICSAKVTSEVGWGADFQIYKCPSSQQHQRASRNWTRGLVFAQDELVGCRKKTECLLTFSSSKSKKLRC
jgi:hypothetical protein